MRILLLSWYFPPINDIGAVRVGKLAEYLHAHGHEVWVVTARRNDPDRSLPLDIPADRVVSTGWIDVDRLSSPWSWVRRPVANKEISRNEGSNPTEASDLSLRKRLAREYMWLVRIPDRQGGWLPYLLRAGSRLLSKQKFDLIYASGPPFTTFFAAKNLSRRFGVPWVAEYRDGWSDYHYTPKPRWRGRVDAFFENRVTPSAAGIVAVSDPWAQFYEQEFRKPTVAIYNGFDPSQGLQPPSQGRPGLPLTMVHMGTVYSGLRDPTVLFEAINLAGINPGEVELGFYGAVAGSVIPLAAKFGVTQLVTVPPRVPYNRALEIQRHSDILLLLQSPADLGNVPAKTFEYFAARRPILGLGLDEGIPAKLVRERNAGFYITDAAAVAAQLKTWVEQKRRDGLIPALPESAAAGLSREEQLARLESFLEDLAHPAEAAARSAYRKEEAEAGVRPRKLREMLPADADAIVDFSSVQKPRLLVIVDAEEEFDWEKPFSRSTSSVTTMKRQHLAHEIFARYGIVPTYAVDYPVADREEGYKPLLELLRDGLCEIGAQLHAWVTPPQIEEVGERNSFGGNLPEELEFSKLSNLTERIEANLGVRPRLFRAGRYGAGANTPHILKRLGYTMDCSVLPQARRNSRYAPDYTGAPVSPYWIGSGTKLLEIPVTRSMTGLAYRAETTLAPYLFSHTATALRVPGVMARLRLLDEIRLSPEGTTLNEAKRLTRFLLAAGQKVFVVSYHTPSLGLGHTPYVRNAADLQKFLGWLEGYLEYFFGEVGGAPGTPEQIRQVALTAPSRPRQRAGEATESLRVRA